MFRCEDDYRDFFQLLSVGIEGPRISGAEKKALRQYPPSGIILFERNVENAGQLRELVLELRDIIIESSGFAPLIMADHEGGRISVLASALGVPPSQMAVAEAKSVKKRRDVYRETSRLVKSCGVNVILSPLADINSNHLNPVIGTRAFGSDCGEVSELVSLAVETYRKEGLLTCLKHFPGHGSTSEDSHLTLPVAPITLDEFKEREVLPFISGIKAGADMIMTAHIKPRDRVLPASMDPAAVRYLLREELSFEGVIITDALEMSGASLLPAGEDNRGDLRSLAGRALTAGNDILLFSRPVCEIVDEMENAFAGYSLEDTFAGGCFRKIHSEAAPRIIKLRKRFIDFAPKMRPSLSETDPLDTAVEMEKSHAPDYRSSAYLAIAEDSVRVMRDPDSLLPLRPDYFNACTFFGGRSDFSGSAVKLFILNLVEGALESSSKSNPPRDNALRGVRKAVERLNRLPLEDDLLQVDIPPLPEGEKGSFFELSYNAAGKRNSKVLFLLCRKPVSEDTIRAISSESDVVVVSDWPYAADLLSGDKTVIVTRGIFPAASTIVNRILYEGGDSESH
ncbi:MAG: glycoside hydrolase family 3 N-terminal domain-containing protein [Candidatus Krumholzibacteriota bacterium]|nr:glycoside hydrolase family 3 N-terminal domain-containing protein [Candidatus Krumholzibacteriota bacterium]